MSDADTEGRTWQYEADLLSQGRERVEAFCQNWRYRNLYPSGDNVAIVLRAYQALQVERTTLGGAWSRRRVEQRWIRLLDQACRRDALARQVRVRHRIPAPRSRPLPGPQPSCVDRSLRRLHADARDSVRDIVLGMHTAPSPGQTRLSKVFFRISEAMDEFRGHLVNEALSTPSDIPRLHEQHVRLCESPYPRRLGHPLAAFLFVRLPARALAALLALFLAMYFVVYAYLNWAMFDNGRLVASVVTDRLSELLDGDMEFEQVRFGPLLLFDVATGRPHELDIRGVRVFEPPDEHGARHLTAYAEHLSAELNILEIIPLNRLGIPRLLDFPWILHFTDITSHGDFSVEAREIPGDPSGAVGLIRAFQVQREMKLPEGTKTLGIEVDRLSIPNAEVLLRFEEQSTWAVELQTQGIEGSIFFEGHEVGTELPPLLPLRWTASAEQADGEIRALGYRVPLDTFTIDRLADGLDGAPLGDMLLQGRGRVAGTQATLEGTMRDLSDKAEPVTVTAALASDELGPLVEWFLGEVLKSEPSDRPMFVGDGARGRVRVDGPIDDPILTLEAEGLAANLFEDDAWSVNDIDVRLELAQRTVSRQWREQWNEFGPGGALPTRWHVTFDVLRGAALGGYLRLQGIGADDHIILPSTPEDPLLAALDFDAAEVDPAMVFYDFPDLEGTLRGYASGRVEVKDLVLAPDSNGSLSFKRTRLSLDDVRIVRARGPGDDGLPRRLRLDGQLRMDAVQGLEFRNFRLQTDGGRLSGDLGMTADYEDFLASTLEIDIFDGPAFFAALGLSSYVSTLRASLNFKGPYHLLQGTTAPLSLTDLRIGGLALSDRVDARVGFDKGVLRMRADDAPILGGHGPLLVELHLMERGGFADTPRVQLTADLEDMDREDLLGAGVGISGVQLALMVDDGQGGPVPLSDVQARGAAFAERITTRTLDFQNAEARFRFVKDGLDLDALTLEYHAPISPFFSAAREIRHGGLRGSGRVDLSGSVPELDLSVDVENLPISGFADLAFAEAAARGNISTEGSPLRLRGRFDRPRIEGTLHLDAASVMGYPLGSGTITSAVLEEDEPLTADASHGLVLDGSFRGSPSATLPGDAALSWSTRVEVGFPTTPRDRGLDASIKASATTVPITTLLPAPEDARVREKVQAELDDAAVSATYCGSRRASLQACLDRSAAGLSPVEVRVGSAWAHPRPPGAASTGALEDAATRAGCDRRSSLCTENELVAVLDDGLLVLRSPWNIHTGGTDGSTLAINGTLDLDSVAPDARTCARGRPTSARGRSRVTLEGDVDLAGLAAEFDALGLGSPDGGLRLDLTLLGTLDVPDLRGSLVPAGDEAVRFSVSPEILGLKDVGVQTNRVIPLRFSELSVLVEGREVAADVTLALFDEALQFEARGALLGQCPGRYDLRVNGALSGELLAVLAPDLITSASGALQVDELRIEGDMQRLAERPIDQLRGRLRVDPRSALRLTTPFDRLDLGGGVIVLETCSSSDGATCGPPEDDSAAPPDTLLVAAIGGTKTAEATRAPPDALRASVSGQGDLAVWGEVRLTDDLVGLAGASITASMDRVPFVSTDNGGVPELELSLTSPGLTARIDAFGASSVSGELYLERSRWLRDANVRASLISFEDPVPAPPSQLPELISKATLDVRVKTNAPFRTDINVLKGVEARGEINVAGTVNNPLLSGLVEFERGEIDIPILGEPYRIERGDIRVEDDLGRSEVDILAVGLEPKRIDNQLKTVSLLVEGPLDAITWSCFTAGDTSGQLSTTRGCLDFVVFDAGNPELARADVRRAGGGSLVYARPLTLVGNLTQITVNDLFEDQAPNWETWLPVIRAKVTQLGVEARLDSRPEWLNLGWGQLSFGLNYLRGFPGGLLRNSRRFYGRLSLFGNTTVEFRTGLRNYSQRVLILDPRDYSSLEFGQTWEIPTPR